MLGHDHPPLSEVLEPESGIEPASSGYKAEALPLSYTGRSRWQPSLVPCRGPPALFSGWSPNAGKRSTRADVRHNRRKPAIGGHLGGRRAGHRCCGVFHGEGLRLACQGPVKTGVQRHPEAVKRQSPRTSRFLHRPQPSDVGGTAPCSCI